LPILAEALRQKRKDVVPYIDTQADLSDSLDRETGSGSALDILKSECTAWNAGATNLVFLTGDAGEGKTALLRRLTRAFAENYLAGRSKVVLLHVDTQGRSFVRLEEAVARDLGQLRISGLFYQGVVRLIRHGILAIAIDGFDELLAEIGSGEAYSGLGAFLKQLDGRGIVVAAARSAYFEVENYSAQSRLLLSLPGAQVSIQRLQLRKWEREQTVKFFRDYRNGSGRSIEDPGNLYDELAKVLGKNHVALQRPFLVQTMAAMLASDSGVTKELVSEVSFPNLEVVPKVIEAFLKREVEEKWRDPNGTPYLTLEQHIHLLAAVADEMWTLGVNRLSTSLLQIVAETIVEELGIPPNRRVQIVERVKAHVLLPINDSAPGKEHSFDHEEFLNYFLAARLIELGKSKQYGGLQRFCERHSLPTIVGRWMTFMAAWDPNQAADIINNLSTLTASELKSTYLKQNAGLIASQMARSCDQPIRSLKFDSMYFEGDAWACATLEEAGFRKCTFNGIDLSGTSWKSCTLVDCRIDGLAYDRETDLTGTVFDAGCQILGVLQKYVADGMRNYVPEECQRILEDLGAKVEKAPELPFGPVVPIPEESRSALNAFLRIFNRNSGAVDDVIATKLGVRLAHFEKYVLPLLEKYNVVKGTSYRGRGKHDRYELNFPIELILQAEDSTAQAPDNLKAFWSALRDT
jgi:NACHT domain